MPLYEYALRQARSKTHLVRVKHDIIVIIQQLAKRENRPVTAQLDHMLRQQLGPKLAKFRKDNDPRLAKNNPL